MIVLGIDPGTATTGYGLVDEEDGKLSLVECGIIATAAGQALPLRLQAIYRGLAGLVRAFRPDAAAVEELFFSRNARTALAVGHARGVALLALADAGLAVAEYKPMQVKQAVAGYGGADKHQVQEMVRLLLDLDRAPQPDDAADAVAIAICHIHAARMEKLVAGSA
ncbi:MAG TPA: crossover junction endodeoxyribonuclease RuvC [Anaerolineae bacterium]|nr:crossover junction endodeoxyribonuclease RuvC [Anaerolineae bacterium]